LLLIVCYFLLLFFPISLLIHHFNRKSWFCFFSNDVFVSYSPSPSTSDFSLDIQNALVLYSQRQKAMPYQLSISTHKYFVSELRLLSLSKYRRINTQGTLICNLAAFVLKIKLKMKTEIYLVRHGQTEWNIQKRYQGSGDSPLTKLGIEQAKALANHLSEIHFDAIYCSPAGRAQTTTKIIKGNRNLNIVTVNELQEINLDTWEGQFYEDTKKQEPALYQAFWHSPDLFKPETGESFLDVATRIYPALLNIIEQNIGKRILIVSHAVALKSIINKITGLPLNRFWENRLFQTSVSILDYLNGNFSILKYGDIEHFDELKKL